MFPDILFFLDPPYFKPGSGGGARGCGFEERVGLHARTGGIQFPMASLSVCVSCRKTAVGPSKRVARKVARLPRRGAESTPRPQGRWVSYARRHALPVCGSDNPRRLQLLTPVLGFENGREREGGAGAPRRMGRVMA